MKAVVCAQPGEIGLTEWPKPRADAGLVMLKVSRVGICGTDYHIYSGNHPFLEYPRIMGHELSGIVAGVPQGSEFAKDDRVIVNPYIPCGKCIACRKSKPNCCVNIKVLGVHGDGGMCEYLAVPEMALYPAGNLSLEQGAMAEFLSVGAHAVRRAGSIAGDRVLVVGVGPIGLGTALIARLEGAEVTVVDASVARVDKARDLFGFDNAFRTSDQLAGQLSDLTDGEFYDAVFDATGNAQAIEAGFHFVAHGGRYVLVSVVKHDITFSDPEFHKREMSLFGSRNATRQDFAYVVRNIENGNIPTEKLHTHSCTLEQLPEQIPKWIANQDEVIKAIAEI